VDAPAVMDFKSSRNDSDHADGIPVGSAAPALPGGVLHGQSSFLPQLMGS
jgi:hypothetical protein